MKPLLLASIVGATLIAGGAFVASDLLSTGATPTAAVVGHPAAQQTANARTVSLQVDNMYCASCPYIVKRALEGTTGVIAADVSFHEKRALVKYDPSKTELAALIKATSDVGYPSRPTGN